MERKEKKKLPKLSWRDFGVEKIILIAVAGVILILTNVSEWKNDSGKEETDSQETAQSEENDAYAEALENRLVHILENVDGVGKVEVMITLKSSGESVLNKDLAQESETEEESADGTVKTSQSQKKEEETVLADENGNSAPYVVKEMKPEIAGVIISCEGADDNVVAASVTEAARVLFDISANHIKVLKMEVSE